ncbi:MAG: YkgJ family cysteine cluster protein [Desulfuromonadales bacterium]|nr:YkgJ family cysteine cluster protein [Desulfuromonadales bacterium]
MKQVPAKIRTIESRENKGSHGAWRKEFCRHYLQVLSRIRSNTQETLAATLALQGERITCREGCTYCCHHYVTVSAAHGIAIVEHLYQRKDLLLLFLQHYEKWQAKGAAIGADIDRIRNEALAAAKPMPEVVNVTRPLASRYFERNIPCPFLVGSRCSIYEVRPLVCSGHCAASPPGWCAPGSPQEPVVHNLVPQDEDLMAIMRLVDPRLVLYELTLPVMVYTLLHEGSSPVLTGLAR